MLEGTLELIRCRWPELEDLVLDGTLIAVPRAKDYVERRKDGYKEPEIVFLVGTAHVSQRSAEDVRRVVKAVQPENVVVEVCSSRVALLYGDDEECDHQDGANHDDINGKGTTLRGGAMVLSGNDFFSTINRSIRLGGRSALILRLLLGTLSERLSSTLGIRTGIEFRAARKAADEINAQIVLGDRPIEVTLRRAWDALTWNDRMKIIRELVDGMTTISSMSSGQINNSDREDSLAHFDMKTPSSSWVSNLEEFRDDDLVTSMLNVLTKRYPDAARALVHERDLYLAWSLKRSKAVNGTRNVVGVLGRGHIRGVSYALLNDNGSLRFRDLAGSRHGASAGKKKAVSQTFQESWVARLVVETCLFTGLWWLWSQSKF